MRILVTYGSKMGGTASLAKMIAGALRRHAVNADVQAAAAERSLASYEAVIIGGALCAGHWHRDARRFVEHHRRDLRSILVRLFSSGPASANRAGSEAITLDVSRPVEQPP